MPAPVAPQFRPRGFQSQDRKRRRRRYALLAGAGVGLVLAVGLALVFILGNDDKAAAGLPTVVSRSTAGTAGGPEPQLAAPAVRFLPLVEELRPRTIVHRPETFSLTPLSWATNGLFTSTEAGEAKAEQLGFIDGYQTAFRPDGQLASVLQGEWFTTIEVAIFGDASKAQQAYALYEQRYREAAGSEQQVTKGLGNQSSAWRLVEGTIPNSDMVAVYHRFVFRRGNMVASVQTFGGEPFMTIDQARDTAVLIDEKALGNRPAPTPTPAATGTPGLPK